MPKTYLFDVAELLGYLREKLRPYLGRGADFINATTMLGGVVDIVIYGRTIHHSISPTVQMTDLGIPSDVARSTVEELCSSLHVMFSRNLGNVNTSFMYEWELNELTGTLTLQEKQRRIDPVPLPNVDVISAYRSQVKKVIEEGGWVSESVKRNLGL